MLNTVPISYNIMFVPRMTWNCINYDLKFNSESFFRDDPIVEGLLAITKFNVRLTRANKGIQKMSYQ